MLSLSAISEASLKSLFDNLLSRCVVLLEDIDAVSSDRSSDTEIDFRKVATGSPSQKSKSTSGKVSLSALLNVIDGVGSQEGRILIMTTNYIIRLDEALVRPGRVDKKIELRLADKKMTADLFCFIFKPTECDAALPEDADVLATEAVRSQREEDTKRVGLLAKEFAARVPELEFSPAEISSFLLGYRQSPQEAIDNVKQLISKPIAAKSKPPRISEDTQPVIARDSKFVRL